MSYHLKAIGPRAAVVAAVVATLHMPPNLKAAIIDQVNEPGNGFTDHSKSPVAAVPHTFARVEAYGHSGGGYGNIGKVEVELFTPLPEPVPAPAEAPASG